MTYEKIELKLKSGLIGMLPNYNGYFYWDYNLNKPYMKYEDYKKYDLDWEKQRNDWYYII